MIKKGERDIHNAFKKELNERVERLVDTIWNNMVVRGFLCGDEEGMEKSELYLLALKMRQITTEQIIDKLKKEILKIE